MPLHSSSIGACAGAVMLQVTPWWSALHAYVPRGRATVVRISTARLAEQRERIVDHAVAIAVDSIAQLFVGCDSSGRGELDLVLEFADSPVLPGAFGSGLSQAPSSGTCSSARPSQGSSASSKPSQSLSRPSQISGSALDAFELAAIRELVVAIRETEIARQDRALAVLATRRGVLDRAHVAAAAAVVHVVREVEALVDDTVGVIVVFVAFFGRSGACVGQRTSGVGLHRSARIVVAVARVFARPAAFVAASAGALAPAPPSRMLRPPLDLPASDARWSSANGSTVQPATSRAAHATDAARWRAIIVASCAPAAASTTPGECGRHGPRRGVAMLHAQPPPPAATTKARLHIRAARAGAAIWQSER